MKKYILLFYVAIVSACAATKKEVAYCEAINPEIGCEVPLVAVLVNPNLYDKRYITVKAFILKENLSYYMSLHPSSESKMLGVYPFIKLYKENIEEEIYDDELYSISGFFDHKNKSISADYISILAPLNTGYKIIKADEIESE